MARKRDCRMAGATLNNKRGIAKTKPRTGRGFGSLYLQQDYAKFPSAVQSLLNMKGQTMANWYSNQTQIAWTCDQLLKGNAIGHQAEFHAVQGWRLAAITHTLRTKYKWPIIAEYRGPENIAFYRLAPGTERKALRFPPSAKELGENGGDA